MVSEYKKPAVPFRRKKAVTILSVNKRILVQPNFTKLFKPIRAASVSVTMMRRGQVFMVCLKPRAHQPILVVVASVKTHRSLVRSGSRNLIRCWSCWQTKGTIEIEKGLAKVQFHVLQNLVYRR